MRLSAMIVVFGVIIGVGPDTFVNEKTRETITGRLIARMEVGGQPVLAIQDQAGRSRRLVGPEWKVILADRPATRPVTPKPPPDEPPLVPKSPADWTHKQGKPVQDRDGESKTVWSTAGIEAGWPVAIVKHEVPFLRQGHYQVYVRLKTSGAIPKWPLAVVLGCPGMAPQERWVDAWPHADGQFHDLTLDLDCPRDLRKVTLGVYRGVYCTQDILLDKVLLERLPERLVAKKLIYTLSGALAPSAPIRWSGTYAFRHFEDGTAELRVELEPAYTNVEVVPGDLQVQLVSEEGEFFEIEAPGTIQTGAAPGKIRFVSCFDPGKRKIRQLTVSVRGKSRTRSNP